MTPRKRRVAGADGLELALHEWSHEGVPLLLVHGFGNDAHVWDEVAPALAPYYRTVALDLRGHGDSDHDAEARYDHLSMVRDLEAVTEALGFERLVLVGHSLGGRVSMRFAGRNPAKMAGLVIVDAGPEFDARGVTRIRLEAETAADSFASVDEYLALLVQNYPATPVETLARLARHWVRPRDDGRFEIKMDAALRRGRVPRGVDEETWMRQENEALWAALRDTPCPTLVVRGAASDVLSADTADRMVDEVLKDGRLCVVSRAGHSVMLDNVEEFRAALSGFVLGDA